MATLVLSLAGQAVGGAIAGPIGATVGRAVGAIAGSFVDDMLFAPQPAPTALPDARILGSVEGGAIPRIYGWNRMSGNIIWASKFLRQTADQTGAKGTSNTPNEELVATFAIAFCEGEVSHLGRIWADNRLLETEGLSYTFYHGTEDQLPNAIIQSVQGAEQTPAYRGTSYLVFDALPIGQFGNRIPNISVELCRVAGQLENQIKAVCIIPGATEFGYDKEPRAKIIGNGALEPENTHQLSQTSDWTVSIEQLLDVCPNLTNVAIIVTWYANDLRCDQCKIEPRVVNHEKSVTNTSWKVAGLAREQAKIVSQIDGAGAFGGTPSDASVLAAITDLKSRGIAVTLYPFVMADIPPSNQLPDPWSLAAGQPAFPWRGRLTCNPAPGVAGSPDQSSIAADQVSSFVGAAEASNFSISGDQIQFSGGNDWGYRRMILHYAALAQIAGGVDAFLIGSEMRGMTQIRSSASNFPFVTELKDLAAEARILLGANTKISYAADWSEYHGYQPDDAAGDKFFHLDPLWGDANIDAVCIDNYFPISDWRGDGIGIDAQEYASVYDVDYLNAGIAGGENFDWFYASPADRIAQVRLPITDATYNEPWIWRSKDLVSWWSNQHFDRIAGVKQSSVTDWVPQSKPIWFTELGCGAVDKGSNQPNAFSDPKSSESLVPYFSSGKPDALMQRQFLRAQYLHWNPDSADFEETNNPTSSVYAGRMLDLDYTYLWAWDARPFPAFPTQNSIWADGENYASGHWLNGRLGAAAADEVAMALCTDWGVILDRAEARGSLISGYSIAHPQTLRSALEAVLAGSDLMVRQTGGALELVGSKAIPNYELFENEMAAEHTPIEKQTRSAPEEQLNQFELVYADQLDDYQSAAASALAPSGANRTKKISPLVLQPHAASHIAATELAAARTEDELQIELPPSHLAMQVGDTFSLNGDTRHHFRVHMLRHADTIRVSATSAPDRTSLFSNVSISKKVSNLGAGLAAPHLVLAAIPSGEEDAQGMTLVAGAYSSPWPGVLSLSAHEGATQIADLSANAKICEITQIVNAPQTNVWDHASSMVVTLGAGQHLSSLESHALLNGGNRALIQHDNGHWEMIAFQSATLLAANTYQLRGLLRGLNGTDAFAPNTVSIGNEMMIFSAETERWPVPSSLIGGSATISADAYAMPITTTPIDLDFPIDLVEPLPPCHGRAKRNLFDDDVAISWVRRTRGNDNWEAVEVELETTSEMYRLQIWDGATLKREQILMVNAFVYSTADQVADFGSVPSSFDISVAQLSEVWGVGALSTFNFSVS